MEQLNKTNPRTVDFEAIRGGVSELTASEIAAMLQGANDGEFYLAMTKYADQGHIPIIVHFLYDNRERYKIKKTTKEMIELVVTEYVDPCRCTVCKGTKFVKARVCPECSGSGHFKLADAQKRDYLGLEAYKGKRTLYERIYNVLNDFDCEALYLFYLHNVRG